LRGLNFGEDRGVIEAESEHEVEGFFDREGTQEILRGFAWGVVSGITAGVVGGAFTVFWLWVLR
jgi:hypothetical protein